MFSLHLIFFCFLVFHFYCWFCVCVCVLVLLCCCCFVLFSFFIERKQSPKGEITLVRAIGFLSRLNSGWWQNNLSKNSKYRGKIKEEWWHTIKFWKLVQISLCLQIRIKEKNVVLLPFVVAFINEVLLPPAFVWMDRQLKIQPF